MLEKQIEDLLKQKNTLDSSVLNLSKEKTTLSASIENYVKREAETKAILADLSTQVIKLSGELKRSEMLKNENDRLLVEIKSNEKKKSDIIREISDKRISIDTIETVEVNKAELLNIKKVINEEPARLNSIKNTAKRQNAENNNLSIELASVTEKLESSKRENNSLSERIAVKNKQLYTLNNKIATKTNELDLINTKFENAKNITAQLDAKRAEYNELVKKNSEFAISLNDLSNRIYEETKKLNTLEEEKEQLLLEIQGKSDELNKLNSKIKLLNTKEIKINTILQ